MTKLNIASGLVLSDLDGKQNGVWMCSSDRNRQSTLQRNAPVSQKDYDITIYREIPKTGLIDFSIVIPIFFVVIAKAVSG